MSSITDKQISLLYKRQQLVENITLTEIRIKHADKNNDSETLISAERELSKQKIRLAIIDNKLARIQKKLENLQKFSPM